MRIGPVDSSPVALIVQKYGGSSVPDATAIKRVARRIVETKRAGNDVVVVVSAMGDTTDELIDLQTEPRILLQYIDDVTRRKRNEFAVFFDAGPSYNDRCQQFS